MAISSEFFGDVMIFIIRVNADERIEKDSEIFSIKNLEYTFVCFLSIQSLVTCVTHLPQKVDSNLPYLLWKARNELGIPKMNKKWQILLKHNQTGSEMSIRYRGKNDKFTSISFHRRL